MNGVDIIQLLAQITVKTYTLISSPLLTLSALEKQGLSEGENLVFVK